MGRRVGQVGEKVLVPSIECAGTAFGAGARPLQKHRPMIRNAIVSDLVEGGVSGMEFE